jgi:hypothetical protein
MALLPAQIVRFRLSQQLLARGMTLSGVTGTDGGSRRFWKIGPFNLRV